MALAPVGLRFIVAPFFHLPGRHRCLLLLVLDFISDTNASVGFYLKTKFNIESRSWGQGSISVTGNFL